MRTDTPWNIPPGYSAGDTLPGCLLPCTVWEFVRAPIHARYALYQFDQSRFFSFRSKLPMTARFGLGTGKFPLNLVCIRHFWLVSQSNRQSKSMQLPATGRLRVKARGTRVNPATRRMRSVKVQFSPPSVVCPASCDGTTASNAHGRKPALPRTADTTDNSSSLIETGRAAYCSFSHALMSSYCHVVVVQAPSSALEQYR